MRKALITTGVTSAILILGAGGWYLSSNLTQLSDSRGPIELSRVAQLDKIPSQLSSAEAYPVSEEGFRQATKTMPKVTGIDHLKIDNISCLQGITSVERTADDKRNTVNGLILQGKDPQCIKNISEKINSSSIQVSSVIDNTVLKITPIEYDAQKELKQIQQANSSDIKEAVRVSTFAKSLDFLIDGSKSPDNKERVNELLTALTGVTPANKVFTKSNDSNSSIGQIQDELKPTNRELAQKLLSNTNNQTESHEDTQNGEVQQTRVDYPDWNMISEAVGTYLKDDDQLLGNGNLVDEAPFNKSDYDSITAIDIPLATQLLTEKSYETGNPTRLFIAIKGQTIHYAKK